MGARVGGLAGVLFCGFVLAGLIVGSSSLEDRNQSAETIAGDWAGRHSDLELRTTLLEVGAFFGLWFAAELRTRIDSWGAQREAALVFGGGLVIATAIASSGAATGAAAAVRTLEQDPQVAKTLYLLEEGAGAGLVAGLAAVVAGLTTSRSSAWDCVVDRVDRVQIRPVVAGIVRVYMPALFHR